MELAEWVRRENATVVGSFSDVASGAKAARPGIDGVVNRCAQGGVDAVVVVKIDRLGRSIINVTGLVAKLKEMGVSVICTSQGIDTRDSNPCGRMVLSIMAAFAEFERDLIRERTVSGLHAARDRGVKLGRPSTKLVGDWKPVVKRWNEECGGRGLRELAIRLGGVSTATAARLAKEYDGESVDA